MQDARCAIGLLTGAAVLALAWSACASGKDRAPAHSSDSATPPAAASTPASGAGATPEDLTFTGAVTGHMAAGRKGGVYVCGKLGPRFIADPIEGDIGGAPFDVSITIADGYKGPGSYQSTRELTPGSGYAALTIGLATPGSGTKEWVNGTGANTVVVNSDEHSGTVSADLHSTRNAPGTVHVAGAWRCPPD